MIGVVEKEVEVGIAAVVGQDGHASFVQGGEGLVGPPFWVAEWDIWYCSASAFPVLRSSL